MATTCNDIISRAQSFNTLNQGLTSVSTEMLSRIRADQQTLFTSVAGLARDRFKTTAALISSSGASGRSFDISAITPVVERSLKLTLGDGREVFQVDELDTDAELAPRYFVRGLTLIEVGNDWGTTGSKTATLLYVYGATSLSITGSLTQAVSVPDEWTDLLVIPLAMYLNRKDPGRDPQEYADLGAALDETQQAFVSYLTNFGGIQSTRFVQPTPASTPNKK
jgi:hypothetical protein